MDDFEMIRNNELIRGYKRAAIYARVSTDKQEEEGTSLITQVEKCLSYCKEQKYIVEDGHFYREVWTGAQYRERPELSKLRAAARNHEFEVIVFYAFDRLSRNQVHQAVIIDDLQHNDINLECVTEQFDDSPVGRFMRSAQSFVSEVEREKIRERAERGFLHRYEEGKMIGAGPAAYGYKWNKGRTAFDIEPTEAEVIRRIFNLYKDDISLHQIACILTNEQIPTRMSKEGEPPKGWSLSSVNHILKNSSYVGEAYGRKWQNVVKSGSKTFVRRPSEDRIPLPEGTVPAIIDREIFDIVQAKLTRNREVSARRNMNTEDSLLRCGFIFCGKCGRRMIVQRNAPTKHNPSGQIFYTCKRGGQVTSTECRQVAIAVKLVDPNAWSFVVKHLKNHELIKNKIKEIKKQDARLDELAPVERNISRVIAEQDNLALAISKVDMNQAGSIHAINSLTGLLGQKAEERQKLEAEKYKIIEQQKHLRSIDSDLDAFEKKCIEISENLSIEADYKTKREVIEFLGLHVTVWPYKSDPRYKFELAPPSIVSNKPWPDG